jgi:hypothetical protein
MRRDILPSAAESPLWLLALRYDLYNVSHRDSEVGLARHVEVELVRKEIV